MRVQLKDGQPYYIDGNRDHPANHGVPCAKGAAGLKNYPSPAADHAAQAHRPAGREQVRGSLLGRGT